MSKMVSFRISDELKAAIDIEADGAAVSFSAWCVDVLDAKVNDTPIPNKIIKSPGDATKAIQSMTTTKQPSIPAKVTIPAGITMSMREAKALRFERMKGN